MNACRTISVSIGRSPSAVYDYLANPAHFPEWSAFITAVRSDGADWIASTPNGDVRIAFTPRNPFMILDHDVTTSSGHTVHVPMRVVPNSEGSEVIFTVFRQPGMADDAFDADVETVRRDLLSLKHCLESE